jgi:hypothetical protein
MKAYSLKRTTIQQPDTHAKQPDEEAAAAADTEGTGSGSGAGASDEKSEGHEQTLQGVQEHSVNDLIDEKKRTDESEKV